MQQSGVKALPSIVEDLKKKYDSTKLADAVALLVKLFENLENNPGDDKFRSVKKTNQTLQNKLFCFTGIERIFPALGFSEDGEFYRFNSGNITPITQALILLRAQEVSLRTHEPEGEEAKKRKAQIDADMRKQEEEKQKLLEAMKRDRCDKKEEFKNRPIQSSKATEMKFGSRMVTRKDLDPGCDDPKGG
jgi:hypothetical protein